MVEPHGWVILKDLYALTAMQDGLPWKPLREGVDICSLYQDGDEGPAAALLRYAPGARVPDHRHTGAEFILVLSGSQSDEHGHYPAGTVLASPAGSRHRIVSETGCIVLAIWEKPVRFL